MQYFGGVHVDALHVHLLGADVCLQIPIVDVR